MGGIVGGMEQWKDQWAYANTENYIRMYIRR